MSHILAGSNRSENVHFCALLLWMICTFENNKQLIFTFYFFSSIEESEMAHQVILLSKHYDVKVVRIDRSKPCGSPPRPWVRLTPVGQDDFLGQGTHRVKAASWAWEPFGGCPSLMEQGRLNELGCLFGAELLTGFGRPKKSPCLTRGILPQSLSRASRTFDRSILTTLTS